MSWWKTTPMRDHPDESSTRWKTTLMKDHVDEKPHWWKTTLMKDHPDERPPWWGTILMKNHPHERPHWWQTTLTKYHPNEFLQAHFHVVGMLQFMSDMNQPSLPTHFYSVLVFFILFLCKFLSYGPFNCVFHKFSWRLPVFWLCSSSLISALLVLSTKYLFMKVSFSPDIIPCGWLGSELAN